MEASDLAHIQRIGVVHRIPGRIPLRQAVGAVEQLAEQVDARRRADEHSPALAVGQGWLDDVIPHLRLDLGDLVNHAPVESDAAQGVGVVPTEQADGCLVVLERHGQIGLVHVDGCGADEWVDLGFEARPGDGLGLLQVRGHVDEEAEFVLALDGFVKQLHDGEFGLAGTSVQGEDREPLALEVAPPLPRPWFVAEPDGFSSHPGRP